MVKKGFWFFLLSFGTLLFAENLIMIPKESFLGDETEIRYELSLTENQKVELEKYLNDINLENSSNIIELPIENFESFKDLLTVKNASLRFEPIGIFLDIVFYPWIAGSLTIPAFNLADLLNSYPEKIMVQIPTLTIGSILEKTNTFSLQSYLGPMVIPGTTYVIYGMVILFVILLAILVLLIIKFPVLYPKFQLVFRKIFHSKPYRCACRSIKKIRKKVSSFSNKDFADNCHLILVTYLEQYFKEDFFSCTSSEIYDKLNFIYDGLQSEEIFNLFSTLYEISLRLDFIRFSGLDKSEEMGLSDEERISILDKILNNLLVFEEDEL